MKKYSYLLILLFGFYLSINNVKAASISVTSSNTTVVGNNITVNITLSNDVEAWDFIVGYDSSKLRLISSNLESTTHSVSTSTLNKGSRNYSITFRAISSGTASVSITSADCANVTCSKGSKSITIRTQAEIEAAYSKNNNLSALSVDGYTLDKEFNQSVTEYSVSLEPETTSININAQVADRTASISGAGTREVTDGDNRLEIVVTAENGTTKTYVINANVKEYDPIEVKVKDQSYTVVRKKASLTPPNNYQETTIKINDTDVPAFHSDITGYTLVALKDNEGNQNYYIYENNEYSLYKEYNFHGIILYPEELKEKDIPNNYKKTTISYNDSEIVAYKIKKSSKYALIYGMNVETGIQNIYMYDAKEDTIQIYNQEEIETINEQTNMLMKISIGLGTLSIVLIGIIIGILIKNKKNHKKKIEKEEN